MVLLLCEVEFILILLFLEARLHVLVMFGEQWAGVVHIIASKTRGTMSSATCTGCLQLLLEEVATMPGANGANIEADPDRKSVWNPPRPPPPPPYNK